MEPSRFIGPIQDLLGCMKGRIALRLLKVQRFTEQTVRNVEIGIVRFILILAVYYLAT